MNIEFVIKGTSALLMHNPMMVDPEYEYNRDIKEITKKKKKTDEDLRMIEKLEWLGGLYTACIDGVDRITQPMSKLRKCLINAARISKRGKDVERSISMMGYDGINVPLIYDNSDLPLIEEIDRLRTQTNNLFRSRLSVGVQGKRIMRVRPQFVRWALIVPAVYIEDAGLNFDELESITDLAGKAEGIGDGRSIGYGKFIGHVREVTPTSQPIEPTLAGVSRYLEEYLR